MEYTAEKVIFLNIDSVLNDDYTLTRTKTGCIFGMQPRQYFSLKEEHLKGMITILNGT